MLAKKGKRILARLIDMSIVFVLTIITFLVFIFPNTFNENKYKENLINISNMMEESELYVVNADGTYEQKNEIASFLSIESLYNNKVNKPSIDSVSLTKSLYTFYTEKLSLFDDIKNLSFEVYCNSILKIGTVESNISTYDINTHRFTLTDTTKPDVTILFFMDIYDKACSTVVNSANITKLTNENQSLFLNSITLVIPVLLIYSFIFDLLIPMFSKNAKTLGKHIFKIGLISKDGYKYKKRKLIIRYLIYICVEILLGLITFGGTFLISYTLFMFKRNRCCLHDLFSDSVVIDLEESFFFDNPVEEKYYIERAQRRGIIYE